MVEGARPGGTRHQDLHKLSKRAEGMPNGRQKHYYSAHSLATRVSASTVYRTAIAMVRSESPRAFPNNNFIFTYTN